MCGLFHGLKSPFSIRQDHSEQLLYTYTNCRDNHTLWSDLHKINCSNGGIAPGKGDYHPTVNLRNARERVFGCVTGTSIKQCVQHQELRWLGHVLRMPNHRLPNRVLFSMPN
ncbi:hypothetical protein T265_04965 [Opisthorchis viverrini]|uniref:Uncharacterized protein n=1 Tax=Opisthorchis viverrini TaxID=6198 RepID=A0A074ZLA6_OPIVI|nr:hypothetical protein T265_04965 [Opisthorchis viverrini]KER28128.1 hypothetical protein T265_04965 [Opisthorchis viverrini]